MLSHALKGVGASAVLGLFAVCAQAQPVDLQTVANGLAPAERGLNRTLADVGNGTGQAVDNFGSGLERLGAGLLGGLGDVLGESLGLTRRLFGNQLDPVANTQSFERGVSHQGLARSVLYIRPDPMPATGRAPAVVMLHYANSTPQTMANITMASRLAAEHGIWVILPPAALRSWNISPFIPDPVDDVGFIAEVIEDASENFPIDPKRVYLAGLSRGAFMANRFACDGPDVIAGMAVVAGSLREARARTCARDKPLSMMLVAGSRDAFVPYRGRFGLRSLPETFEFWGRRAGCDPRGMRVGQFPDRFDDGVEVTLAVNPDCEPGEEIRLYTVEGGTHAWYGGNTLLNSLPPFRSNRIRDINTTTEIARFVNRGVGVP